MPIDTVEDLREHLLLAIEVELSTIPPYLYAMYSIEDQGSEAALLIRSVVVEEMLHASLVANMLVAVGGEPRFSSADVMPSYPGPMLHHVPPLILHLERCSVEFVEGTMMAIERPESPGAPRGLQFVRRSTRSGPPRHAASDLSTRRDTSLI